MCESPIPALHTGLPSLWRCAAHVCPAQKDQEEGRPSLFEERQHPKLLEHPKLLLEGCKACCWGQWSAQTTKG